MPCHHDDWLPGLTFAATDLAPIRALLAERVPGTGLVELDYVSGYPLFTGG